MLSNLIMIHFAIFAWGRPIDFILVLLEIFYQRVICNKRWISTTHVSAHIVYWQIESKAGAISK